MSKKQGSKSSSQATMSLPVVNLHAAGIDVGSRFHVVAVGQNKDNDVQQFGVTTPDLHDLCLHLQSRGISQVVMESTGYYWIPLFWMLQSYGFGFRLNLFNIAIIRWDWAVPVSRPGQKGFGTWWFGASY